jgi:hypothetical protein
MKTKLGRLNQCFFALLACSVLAGKAATNDATAELPYQVHYELGDREFAPGDNITLLEVRGTSDTIRVGQTYSVTGVYTLSSRDEAELSFFATTSNPAPTPVDPKQTVRIKKGTGSFRLVKTMAEDGYLHVTFYAGSGFGGVYFGQGDRVLRNKQFSFGDNASRSAGVPVEAPIAVAGPNQVLFEYLGNAVEPPANLDSAYTREGLINAVRAAGQSAGVSLKKIEIDDSEFPFLVGLVCEEEDFPKLKAQLKKMDGYEFSGSVGSHTQYAINIVPWRVFPAESSQRISHRLTLRQQVFFDRFTAQK